MSATVKPTEIGNCSHPLLLLMTPRVFRGEGREVSAAMRDRERGIVAPRWGTVDRRAGGTGEKRRTVRANGARERRPARAGSRIASTARAGSAPPGADRRDARAVPGGDAAA